MSKIPQQPPTPPVRHPDALDTVGMQENVPPGMTETPRRIGEFTVIRVLGEGGMGTVYLAEDVQLGRKAAIKTMKPELAAWPENRQRFVREARAAATVEHDNVVPIWQVGQAADGSPFIAMPFLQGEMLEARLQRERVQPVGVILKVAREVADGLAAAHVRGLMHRDIKPANVWIEGDPESTDLTKKVRRCKILDFGLARCVESEDVQVTASGTILGTPAYMAPEQAAGEKVDHRSDLFSLGVMLYRMATGKLPFSGPNTMAVLTALATKTPPTVRSANPNVPQALSDLIARLMSKEPEGRPQSAAEVAAAVRQIVKELQAKKLAPAAAAPAAAAPVTQAQPAPIVPAAPAEVAEKTVAVAVEAAPAPTPRAKAGRSRMVVVAALVVLALALVPLGWWLATVVLRVETPEGTLVVEIDDPEVEARIKGGKLILTGPDDKVRYTLIPSDRNKKLDAGPYKLHVEGADGLVLDTTEFTLKKGDKVTVRVRLDPKVVAKNLDADRKAAAYVLSIGGTVRLNDKDLDISKAADLPPEPFRLTSVNLISNPQVSDAGLAHFQDCKNLTHLHLYYTKVGDAGLAHFKDCKNLTHLHLQGTKVGDAGLAHFKDCKNLTQIDLYGTQVSDTGLAHFKDCKNLMYLHLQSTKVGDAGLAHFTGCKNLTNLVLNDTKVSDTGLAHFTGCKNLTLLDLNDTEVSDAGLAHFKDCKNLEVLQLHSTKVSDTGLAHFKDCKKLTLLWLGNTQVSDIGLAHFRDCKNLTILGLLGTQVDDAGLAYFKDCKNLTQLYLERTQVSDVGLAHLKDCKNLTLLNLHRTRVSDAGLAHFKDCKNLTFLGLKKTKVTAAKIEELKKALPKCKIEWDGGIIEPMIGSEPDRKAAAYVLSIGGTVRLNDEDREISKAADLPAEPFRLTLVGLAGNKKVSDAGLAHFKDCKNLTSLVLSWTWVSDAGLAHFRDCKNLTQLYLQQTRVSDAGLAHFKDCKNLTQLGLYDTKVGDAGLAHFKDCKHLTKIDLDGTQVSDTGLAHFKDCKNLTQLGLSNTQVSDAGLTHFKDCKNLLGLNLNSTKVGDAGLTHLKDCKNLTHLNVQGTQVTDLSLLEGLPLKDLTCVFCPERDTEILRSIKTLETINGKPAAEFWKAVDARQAALQAWLKRVATLPAEKQVEEFQAKLKELNPDFDGQVTHKIEGNVVTEITFVTDKVTDIAPLQVFNALRKLDCRGTRINDLRGNGQLADLTPLKGMNFTGLTHLVLNYTHVGDAGLVHFKDCKNLTILGLLGTKVSDAGLAHFKDSKNLAHINLDGTQVSDAGLAHLKDCKHLAWLGLGATKMSDAGLVYFKDCKNLTHINLGMAQVGDTGLAHLKECKNLAGLNLDWTKVSDAGLAHFKGHKSLKSLGLNGTQVSDAGLAYFKDCKNLAVINLQGTQVTDLSLLKGLPLKTLWCDFKPERDTEILRSIKTLETINDKPVAEFWKAVDARQAELQAWLKRVATLPAEKQVEEFKARMKELNPDFDGQVTHMIEGNVVTEITFVTDKVTDIAPLQVFNALRKLDCSGTFTNERVNGQLADLTPLKGMNLTGLTQLFLRFTKVSDAGLAHFKDCKHLTKLDLQRSAQVSDAGLAHFKDCKNLTSLNLSDMQVSDAGLAPFKNCKNLRDLSLAGTKVGDTGLAHFTNCKNLTSLNLGWTPVGDTGVAHFKDCKNLTMLKLDGTQVSDAGLVHFKDCKNLTSLNLSDMQVSDTGLAQLMDCKNLTRLQVKKTKVTAAKIEELKKALPKCRIEWDGGVIEPTAK